MILLILIVCFILLRIIRESNAAKGVGPGQWVDISYLIQTRPVDDRGICHFQTPQVTFYVLRCGSYFVGDVVTVSGRVSTEIAITNNGKKRLINPSIHLKWNVLFWGKYFFSSLDDVLLAGERRGLDTIFLEFPQPQGALAINLLFLNNHFLPQDLKQEINQTGLGPLIHTSTYRLTLTFLVFMFFSHVLQKWRQKNPFFSGLGIIATLAIGVLGFVLTSNLLLSLLFALRVCAVSLRRQISTLYLLISAVLLTLLLEPLSLYQFPFQFAFAIYAAIIVMQGFNLKRGVWVTLWKILFFNFLLFLFTAPLLFYSAGSLNLLSFLLHGVLFLPLFTTFLTVLGYSVTLLTMPFLRYIFEWVAVHLLGALELFIHFLFHYSKSFLLLNYFPVFFAELLLFFLVFSCFFTRFVKKWRTKKLFYSFYRNTIIGC